MTKAGGSFKSLTVLFSRIWFFTKCTSMLAVLRVDRVVRLEWSNPTTRPQLPVFFNWVATVFNRIPRPHTISRANFTVDQSPT
uniref:Uncharacterized protein n=1 Tax=Rhizophora mucronata TaxID=61149 RepID=A0A2P2KJL8_RHIMU